MDNRLKSAIAALTAAGIDAAAFEARVLDESFPDEEQFRQAVERRISSEPLQYILGEWEFWGLPFYVGNGVLIPQPDTEILVEAALDAIKETPSPRVLDLCSGSGCVAISIAHERPDAIVTAVELYEQAFGYLTRNIERNAVSVNAVMCDVKEKPGGFGEFDLIVSNPPYITADEMVKLSSEVLAEPHEALFGGADGLEFYRAIKQNWLPLLADGGTLALEIGFKQAEAVCELYSTQQPRVVRDYSSNDRVVVCKYMGV